MTLFFFVIALELNRELVLGELRDPRVAALPIAAAIGGMIAPAAVFLLLSNRTAEAMASMRRNRMKGLANRSAGILGSRERFSFTSNAPPCVSVAAANRCCSYSGACTS
jgi:hypothetical protein